MASAFEARNEHRPTGMGEDLVAVLGARVQGLLDRHRATQRAVSELQDALAARDRRIVELDAKLASGERARRELVARIDALLADVERMMQAADEDTPGARER
jgi:predicted secreted protein